VLDLVKYVMWLKSFLAAAGCLPMLWLAGAAAQTTTNHSRLVETNLTPRITTPLPLTNGNHVIVISTNRFGSFGNRPFQVPQQPKRANTATNGLAPGVYKTEPYTCIVIVPGEHPDDQSIMHPPETVPNMPMLKPDLRFVPVPPR